MVERIEGKKIEEFVGIARVVEKVDSKFGGTRFHIAIEPIDPSIKELISGNQTGMLHSWIRVSRLTTDDRVVEGSAMDVYLRKVESVIKEAKDKATIEDALKTLIGKKILYRFEQIGRAYKNYEGSKAYVPVILKE